MKNVSKSNKLTIMFVDMKIREKMFWSKRMETDDSEYFLGVENILGKQKKLTMKCLDR